MAEEAKWYVAHTYSGYENTVKATIEKAVENRNMGDLILAVNIPLETVTEITDAGSKDRGAQGLPRLCAGQDGDDRRDLASWSAMCGGSPALSALDNKAIPLTEAEIAALGVEKREVVVSYQVGDNVRITDGALESFLGTVEEIDTGASARSGWSCPCSAGRPPCGAGPGIRIESI